MRPVVGEPSPLIVIVCSVHTAGYPVGEYVGLMSSSRFVKSPTAVGPVPTFVLAPAVLIRTCRRSGNVEPVPRVQNLITLPFASGTSGVTSQPLIVLAPVVKLKFAAIYDVGVPWCDGNTVELPWNQVGTEPTVVLLFWANQPAPGVPAVTVSNPSVSENGVHDGVGLGVPLGVGDAGGVGLGVAGGVGDGLGQAPAKSSTVLVAVDEVPERPLLTMTRPSGKVP